MLADERHLKILSLLKDQGTIKMTELSLITGASEATIRRDLAVLEKKKLLKRVHGGAALLKRMSFEPALDEKANKFKKEKQKIAEKAAGYIADRDCIYLDAGTTTAEIIPYLKEKNVTVLTNGIMHIPTLAAAGIPAMIVGGTVKSTTNAIIGSAAVQFLSQYRFDKCFLGMNGVHPELGYTTPDPEEALLKKTAIQLSTEAFVLADSSKLNETTFAKAADISQALLITDSADEPALEPFLRNPKIKAVTA
ncbi:DeoR/GlpR family DNA-binding transcription regulator [Peribacillus sp. SCS-37]|uniref:DeoR/GlpR family DNA-binding transcription regulator n=1 Tax=Paraperibacillus esterisolvens TaxID=3115296 RepID=UPI0039060ED7